MRTVSDTTRRPPASRQCLSASSARATAIENSCMQHRMQDGSWLSPGRGYLADREILGRSAELLPFRRCVRKDCRIPTPHHEPFLPSMTTKPYRTVVIGCGNPLRGDDAVGPTLIRRLGRHHLPADVACVDAGTDAFGLVGRIKDAARVIFVDACRSGRPPGSLVAWTPSSPARSWPRGLIDLHGCRWDQAIAVGRWLLGDRFPPDLSAWLVEGASFEAAAAVTPAVNAAIDHLVTRLLDDLWADSGGSPHAAVTARFLVGSDGSGS